MVLTVVKTCQRSSPGSVVPVVVMAATLIYLMYGTPTLLYQLLATLSSPTGGRLSQSVLCFRDDVVSSFRGIAGKREIIPSAFTLPLHP
eukprot:scaffold2203_cov176-Amphora_coffeaeformis.AAC.4